MTSSHHRSVVRLGLLALITLTASGCPALLDGFDAGVEPSPDMRVVNAFVGGAWEISGSGRFDECASPFSEVPFQLRSVALIVEQDPAGRLDVPALSAPTDGMFRFEDGSIVGTEVRFATREETDRGPIRLSYHGALDELNNVRGRFEGIGPDACLSSGQFTVRVDLAEPPAWLEPDAAVPDASPAEAGPLDASPVDARRPDASAPDG